jgi:hypothetical protein
MTSKLSFRQCAAYLAKHGQPVSATTGYFDRLKAVQAVKSKLAAVPPAAASAAPAKPTAPKAAPTPLIAATPSSIPAGPAKLPVVVAIKPASPPTPETIGLAVAAAFVSDSTKTYSANLATVEDLAETAARASNQCVWQTRAWARFETNNRRRQLSETPQKSHKI